MSKSPIISIYMTILFNLIYLHDKNIDGLFDSFILIYTSKILQSYRFTRQKYSIIFIYMT